MPSRCLRLTATRAGRWPSAIGRDVPHAARRMVLSDLAWATADGRQSRRAHRGRVARRRRSARRGAPVEAGARAVSCVSRAARRSPPCSPKMRRNRAAGSETPVVARARGRHRDRRTARGGGCFARRPGARYSARIAPARDGADVAQPVPAGREGDRQLRQLQHRRGVRGPGQPGDPEFGEVGRAAEVRRRRRIQLPVHGHADQRFGHVVHAVPVHRQSLHRFGGDGAHAQHLLVLRRGDVQRPQHASVRATAGGAAMLGRSPDFDWALCACYEAPPGGVVVRRLARRPHPGGRRRVDHPSSARRPQEVEPGHADQLLTSSATPASTATSTKSRGPRAPPKAGPAARRC